MKGLQFLPQTPAKEASVNRVDVACFVGCVAFRGGPLPTAIIDWLQDRAWLNRDAAFPSAFHRPEAVELLDVPVLIDDWEMFNQLFVWERRPVAGDLTATTYLGTAVRAFFRQGGRRCYVIRVADPLPYRAERVAREALLARLLPGFPGVLQARESDRTSWHGIGHLFGLPDVSFVSVPDLADLLKTSVEDLSTDAIPSPGVEEQFVECSEPEPAPPKDNGLAEISAPTCDTDALNIWRDAVNRIGNFLVSQRREVTFVTSMPLASLDSDAAVDLQRFMRTHHWLVDNVVVNSQSLASAFVQLAYPWLLTDTSTELPQHLEPPEGMFLGLLAKNALLNGTFHSTVKVAPNNVIRLFPRFPSSQLYAVRRDLGVNERLVDHLSFFATTPQGIQLVSDVTTSSSLAYRNASVSRVVALVVRAARLLGEDYVFESSGETLWFRLQERLRNLLQSLYFLGALDGKNADEAFSVRCDRTTMTQQDIDSGRIIAELVMNPVTSIETIKVALELAPTGGASFTVVGMEA